MSYNILLLDPKIYKIWFAGQEYKQKLTKTAKDWCVQEGADLCFNLGIFSMSTGLGCSYVRAKGKDIAYGNDKPKTLIIDNDNQCKGYSDGIVDGVTKINFPMGGTRTRNGIGITDKGFIIIAQTSHPVTETVFCNYVNSFVKGKGHKVKLFTLQDGGGSTQEYSNLSKLNFAPEGGRKVANVICVKFRGKPNISNPLFVSCPYKSDVELLQMALGGISVDGSFGSGTKSRLTSAQKALGFPQGLQCGIASYKTLKSLGFNPVF